MCGICLVYIKSSSHSDISKSQVSFSEWLHDVGLEESLRRRGPDSFGIHSHQLANSRALHSAAAVLHVRGSDGVTTQPVVNESTGGGSFLLFNGEIYGGLPNLEANSSDTRVLYDYLHRYSNADDNADMVNFLTGLQGPFAVVYFDAIHRRVWFCRDAFGRRSLLYGLPVDSNFHPLDSNIGLILTSVATRLKRSSSTEMIKWYNLPAGYIFCLNFNDNDIANDELICYQLRPVTSPDELIPLRANFERFSLLQMDGTLWDGLVRLSTTTCDLNPPINADDEAFEKWYLDHYTNELEQFISLLRQAVKKRLLFISNYCRQCNSETGQDECSHSKVALLFSGGVDSLLLAVLIAEEFEGKSVDLLNVSFALGSNEAPDRKTGKAAFMELNRLYPDSCRRWKFVEINVGPLEVAERRQERIADLVLPSDRILDDGIGCVLWFAARGEKIDPIGKEAYSCSCRVIFLGTGADELLGGYSRHRKRYFDEHTQRDRDAALIEELEMELRRIGSRNLARDDRVVADHGRESRLPYLDEDFVKYVNTLPLNVKVDFRRGRGIGEKLILRMALLKLGVKSELYRLPKRAMQFGSRIANSKENGNARCNRLLRELEGPDLA